MVERQGSFLADEFVEALRLAVARIGVLDDADVRELLLHLRAEGEDRVALLAQEDELDRRGVETADALEEASDITEVLLEDPLEVDGAPLLVHELEEVLHEHRQLE